jgi:tRNA(fMet)-specific endonuclease VapC
MSFWIIDTDHVSLFLSDNQKVRDRILRVSSNAAVTIVTVQEVFNGWISEVNDPSQSAYWVELYTSLWISLDFFKSVRVLNFDAPANQCCQRLLQEHPILNKKRLHNKGTSKNRCADSQNP